MRRYKVDMKAPMQSAWSGTLVNVSLIQMQKVKVMTEAAMLRLDQLLATNQLTMASMAALPALVLISVSSFVLGKLFTMNPPTTAAKTLHLRLLLADVERCLQEVYSPTAADSASGSIRPVSSMISSPSFSNVNSISPRQVRMSLGNHGPFQFSDDIASQTMQDKTPGASHAINSTRAQRHLSTIFPDEEDIPQAPPIVRVNSASARSGDTFRYMENARLISRGLLTTSLLEMRKELVQAFTPRYVRWLRALPQFLFESSSFGGGSKHTNASWFRLPMRIIKRMLWSEIGTSAGDKEYEAILGDVEKLEAPEDEVSGADKIIVAARMRQSYLCFSMN